MAPKPKPKYDPATGKWVVKSWDGSVAGIPDGDKRSFESLSDDAWKSAEATQSISTLSQQMDRTNSNNTPSLSAAPTAPQTQPPVTASGPPFAKIDAVAPLSPAATAGFQAGDLIVKFGDIHHDNNDNLRALMDVVTYAADAQAEIAITLLRKDEAGTSNAVRLGLVPKPWPGRGLLGCHILPYTA